MRAFNRKDCEFLVSPFSLLFFYFLFIYLFIFYLFLFFLSEKFKMIITLYERIGDILKFICYMRQTACFIVTI